MLRAIAGPIERRIGAHGLSRLCSVADQGATGLANILAFALLGRALAVEQFGAVGMMVGVHYFIAGFHRSAVVLPFTADHRAVHDARRRHEEDSGWWWIGLAAAMALSVLLGLAGTLLLPLAQAHPGWRWAITPMLTAAAISPAMLAWEFARRWLYKIGRADLVALLSAAYFAVMIAGAWLVARHAPGAAAAALAWIAASGVAALGGLAALRPARPDARAIGRIVREHRAAAGWLAATNLPYAVYGSATVVVVIGLLVGPIAAALFTAARTLTNPAISIVSAIDATDKPRAAQALATQGFGAFLNVIGGTRRSIALSTGLYLALVALAAPPLVHFAFHGQYDGLEGEVRLLALGFFLFGLNQPTETLLIVLRAGRTMLAVRSITAAATVITLMLAVPFGVRGMALAIAATQALNLALLLIVERAMIGRHRPTGEAKA